MSDDDAEDDGENNLVDLGGGARAMSEEDDDDEAEEKKNNRGARSASEDAEEDEEDPTPVRLVKPLKRGRELAQCEREFKPLKSRKKELSDQVLQKLLMFPKNQQTLTTAGFVMVPKVNKPKATLNLKILKAAVGAFNAENPEAQIQEEAFFEFLSDFCKKAAAAKKPKVSLKISEAA